MMGAAFNIESLTDKILVRDTATLSKGHIRLETGFRYPDGSVVDLYIANPDLLAGVAPVTLTDFGNTLSWLGHLGIDPLRQKRRLKLMEDVLDTYSVNRDGAAIQCQANPDDIKSAILRLGQACVRIADLSYMLRFRSPGVFADDVEEIVAETSLEYEPDAIIPGRKGAPVKVDMLVNSPHLPTAIMIMPTRGQGLYQLRQRSEHVFTTFFDLAEWSGQRLGIVESDGNSYPENEIDRLTAIGTMIRSTSNQADIVQYLRGYIN
jgi:hypothetical protein